MLNVHSPDRRMFSIFYLIKTEVNGILPFSFSICMNQNPAAGFTAERTFKMGEKKQEQKTRTKNKNKNKNIAHRYSKQRLIRKHFISERLADERECIVELSFKIDIYTILARRSRFDLNEFRDICK